MRRVAVVGGGWAGLAAAVEAVTQGCEVTVFEASRHWGGRARRLALPLSKTEPHTNARLGESPDSHITVDNGQHILIGAYTATLSMMARVGVQLDEALHATPLALPFPDGSGLACPTWAQRWPAPLDTLATIAQARGWTWADRWAFVKTAARWRLQGFQCNPSLTVSALCNNLPRRVVDDLIDPLCVAALNTPADQASAQVFLRVLRDALLGQGHAPWRSADLLLPRRDLGQLLPDAAVAWLKERGAQLHSGARVTGLEPMDGRWALHGTLPSARTGAAPETWFDDVVLACPPRPAAALLTTLRHTPAWTAALQDWCDQAQAFEYEAIGTVYAMTPGAPWSSPHPMLALRGGPAQFVFDRGQLGGPDGLVAFVASAWNGTVQDLETQVRQQAQQQLGLTDLAVVGTVVEKQATFACTPGLRRPGMNPAPRLWTAGDAIDGPYPATLEGAVRSGQDAVRALVAHPLTRCAQPPSKPHAHPAGRNAPPNPGSGETAPSDPGPGAPS